MTVFERRTAPIGRRSRSASRRARGRARGRAARTAFLAASLTIALIAGACAPDPGPSGPTWHSTRFARTVDASGIVSNVGAWTDANWFATMRIVTTTSTTGDLRISPRSGPGGGTIGAPQVLPLPALPSGSGPIGEHVVAVVTTTGVVFYEETAGTWAEAGSLTLPNEYMVAGLTDHWLVARRPSNAPSGGDSHVLIYAIDASGPGVTATLHQTLDPDPTWSPGRRDGFGSSVAIDGDLLAVTAPDSHVGTGAFVRVYRATAGIWSLVETLGDGVTMQRQTSALAVEDGPTVDRIILSPFITSPATPAVDVWADTGSGFSIEQHIELSSALPDASGGNLFGSSVAIDGDLLAITSRSTTVPSAQVGHAPVTVGFVQLYRLTTGWNLEHEAALFPDPYEAGTQQAIPFRLQVADGHVAVYVMTAPDAPPGCQFPCFTVGMEAWSLDRY